MSVFLSVLKTLGALILAMAINLGLYTYTVTKNDYEIRKELADSGIKISDYESRQGLIILEIPAADDVMEETDVMLIRKTLDALRISDLNYSQYYIRLLSPAGKIIYSDMFSNIDKVNSEYAISVPEKEIDNNTYYYLLKYYLSDRDIEMGVFNFYATKGMDLDALYIEVFCEKSNLAETLETIMSRLKSFNDEGGLVFRYSVVFKNSEKESLFAVSVDEYYGDIIYWKSPSCAGIQTIYDNK